MTSRQELFDNAVNGFASQDWERAFDDCSWCCKYRLPKGDKILKCAIGHSIPDKKYRSDLEGYSISAFVFKCHQDGRFSGRTEATIKLMEVTGISKTDIPFAETLQEVHDTGNGRPLGHDYLRFARDYKLDVPQALLDRVVVEKTLFEKSVLESTPPAMM